MQSEVNTIIDDLIQKAVEVGIENEKQDIFEHVGDQVVTDTVKAEIVDMYFDCVNTIKMEKEKERALIKMQAKKLEVSVGDKLLKNFSSMFSKTPTFKKTKSDDPSSKKLLANDKARSVSQIGPVAQKDTFGAVSAFSTVPPKDSSEEESKYSTDFDKTGKEAKPSAVNTIFNRSAPI